jgi:hypothetical protein
LASREKNYALAFLALLFAVNVYRAWTQSIVHDEAYTYELFLDAPASALFERYDPNHHILYTLLAKLCVVLFGPSEFSLRLPSLAAGTLYFFTVYRLSLLLFPGAFPFVLSVLLLSLNPLLLDFLVAARGYGMALALFLYALYQLVLFLSEAGSVARTAPSHRLLHRAAVALGLSIAANLTLLFPVAALTTLFLVALAAVERSTLADSRTQKKKKKRARATVRDPGPGFFRAGCLHLLLPLAILMYGFFLIVPVQMAQLGNFYAGLPSPAESVENLVGLSFSHNDGLWNLNRSSALGKAWDRAIAFGLLPLIALAGAWHWFEISRKWLHREPPAERVEMDAALYLTNGTLLGSCGLLVAAHYLADLPYPVDRTGLYFLPLVTLACVLSLQILRPKGIFGKVFALSFDVVLVIFVVEFAIQFNTSHFAVWRYDADTRTIVKTIEARERGGARSVRVGATWQLEPSLNFYRTTWALNWMQPVDRSGPVGDYDYYVLALGDRGLMDSRHLHKLYDSPRSAVILAVR